MLSFFRTVGIISGKKILPLRKNCFAKLAKRGTSNTWEIEKRSRMRDNEKLDCI